MILIRRLPTVGVLVPMLLLLLSSGMAPTLGQGMGTDLKASLEERQRLWDESRKLLAAGKTAEAIAAAEKKLAIERRLLGEDNPHVADTLGWLCMMQRENEDFDLASESGRLALEILRKRLGDDHWKVIDARQALNDTVQLSKMAPMQRRQQAEADRINQRVMALIRAGRSREAIPLANRVRSVYESLWGKRHPTSATALNNLAEAVKAQGDYDSARTLLEQALALRKSVLGEHHPDYAQSLNNLGELSQLQGDYDSARPLFENSLAILKSVLGERHLKYAYVQHNLAFVLAAQGGYPTARALYEQALATIRSTDGERHPLYAIGLSNLARLLRDAGDYAGARPLYEHALALMKHSPGGERRSEYAGTLADLAFVIRQQGETTAALSLYKEVLDLRKETLGERHPYTIGSLTNLAGFLIALGDIDGAQALCERVQTLTKETSGEHHTEYARALTLVGAVRRAQGNDGEARSCIEKALAIYRSALGDQHPYNSNLLRNLAISFWEQGDYARAASHLEQALEITESNLELAAMAQAERQQLVMAQEFRGALEDYLSIAPLAKKQAPEVYMHVLLIKGAIFARQRRLGLLQRVALERPGSQTARLVSTLRQANAELSALLLAKPAARDEDAWRRQLGALSRKKEGAESALARLDASFRVTSAEARRQPGEIQAVLPKDTALIDFFEYQHGRVADRKWAPSEAHLIAFVVRPGRPIVMLDLGPQRPIADAIEAWRGLIMRRDGESHIPAREVRRLVWEPLEAHLDGIKSVLVSPDGAIGRVPIAALGGKKDGTYLIEDYTLAVVPSARMLGMTPDENIWREAVPSLLLVGDVDYGGVPGPVDTRGTSRSAVKPNERARGLMFGRLPGTSAEVVTIKDDFQGRFPTAEVRTLVGREATEEMLRREAPKNRFLHLATHGYFSPVSPRPSVGPHASGRSISGIDPFGGQDVVEFHPGLLSGIALSGANRRNSAPGQDDGIFTALEVAVLDLSNCELAVLSACETGLGQAAGGEGLLGLQRAFQTAGARSVLASLWNVDDEQTRTLMTRFYQNLWRKGQPPSKALREAQLSMLRGQVEPANSEPDRPRGLQRRAPPSDFRKPYFWAAFVLSTDRP